MPAATPPDTGMPATHMTSATRPLWRATLLGLAIAVAEITALTFSAVALEAFGKPPSGYAGAGWGQGILFLYLFSLAASSTIGIITGAALFRRKRGFLVEWSLMLGCLLIVVAMPICWFML